MMPPRLGRLSLPQLFRMTTGTTQGSLLEERVARQPWLLAGNELEDLASLYRGRVVKVAILDREICRTISI